MGSSQIHPERERFILQRALTSGRSAWEHDPTVAAVLEAAGWPDVDAVQARYRALGGRPIERVVRPAVVQVGLAREAVASTALDHETVALPPPPPAEDLVPEPPPSVAAATERATAATDLGALLLEHAAGEAIAALDAALQPPPASDPVEEPDRAVAGDVQEATAAADAPLHVRCAVCRRQVAHARGEAAAALTEHYADRHPGGRR